MSILSENRHEYLELEFACAKLGVIAACINWRLLDREIAYCINLAEPRLALISPNYHTKVDRGEWMAVDLHVIDEALEEQVANQPDDEPADDVDPEDGLLIVYTSGTTGLPTRSGVSSATIAAGGCSTGSFSGWNAAIPLWLGIGLFHMAGSDFAIGQLLLGGKTLIVDGFDLEEIGRLVATEEISYMGLQPGMIRRLVDYLTERQIVPSWHESRWCDGGPGSRRRTWPM